MSKYSNLGVSLLADESKTTLTDKDLFDRVINLQFTTGFLEKDADDIVTIRNPHKYTLRSDFEVYYPDLDITNIWKQDAAPSNRYYIRKCQMKPSIKVQYTRVSPESLFIDIYINNFYMLSEDGKAIMSFNNDTNPLIGVDLMMGYFGQFKNMPHDSWEDLEKFEAGYGVDLIKVNVLYVNTDKMPPDSVLHIHGAIGSVYATPEAEIKEESFADLEAQGLVERTVDDLAFSNETWLERMFFKYITRRFPRRDADFAELAISEFGTPTEKELKDNPSEKVVRIGKLFDKNGFLTEDIAKKYGTIVYCSEGAKARTKSNAFKITGGNDEETDIEVFFASGFDAANTFNKINTAVGGSLILRKLVTGDFIVYTVEESQKPGELKDKFKMKPIDVEAGSFFYKNTLPAIYNISIGPITNIVAPFYYFISPLETVYFKGRYRATNLVDYYTDTGEGKFKVIKQLISFATVDNINEMTLVCAKGD